MDRPQTEKIDKVTQSDPKNKKQSAPQTAGLPKPGFLATIRNNFFAGIVVAAPIIITGSVVIWLITGPMASLDTFVQHWIPDRFKPEVNLDFYIPGFGVLVAIVGLILLGTFAKNFLGRAMIRVGERFLDSMPVVRNLYGFLKNVFEMALQQSDRSFKEMVLVEYPKKDTWVLGFVVTDTKGEIAHHLGEEGEELISIFVPTTPNPTSGFLLFVPRADTKPLEMTVEEGAKVIFSAGLVTPEFDPSVTPAQKKLSLEKADDKEKRDGLFSSWTKRDK
jgi:uncharacterized membrane protein